MPSTGEVSCGKIVTWSPTCTFSSGTSSSVPSRRTWATDGMRFASALRTLDAFATAYSSSASPPESMSTTNEPARYSPRSIDVTIEIPASRSEPNSRRRALAASSSTSGVPPTKRQISRGMRAASGSESMPKRMTRWAPMVAIARIAIRISRLSQMILSQLMVCHASHLIRPSTMVITGRAPSSHPRNGMLVDFPARWSSLSVQL